MPNNTALNSQAREVIDTSPWFAIATAGPEGPHQAACLTRNIQALNYADTRIRIPVWRLEQTERNLVGQARQSAYTEGTEETLKTHLEGNCYTYVEFRR